MKKLLKPALLTFFLSFTVYSFFQFPGFQGYEDETYDRIISNFELGELKARRSGYAQIILETPLTYLGFKIDSIAKTKKAEYSRLVALMYNPLISAISAAVIFLILCLFVEQQKAFYVSIIYAFGTMALPYSSIGMEPTSVLFILLSIYFLFRFGKSKQEKNLILSGFFFFLLLFSKAYYLVTLPAFIAYILFDGRKEARNEKRGTRNEELEMKNEERITGLSIFHFPLSISLLIKKYFFFFSPLIFLLPLYLLSNKYNFGAYLGGQYNLKDELLGGENVVFGIYGLLLSFGKSIFIYNPILIISVLLFRKYFQKYKKEALFLILYSIFLILFVAQIHWWSDETWGPRYLFSLAPLWILPFAVFDSKSFSFQGAKAAAAAFALILLCATFFMQFLASSVRYDVFPYTFYGIYEKTGYNVLASQEYQYIPQFAPYFVNWQVLKNRILDRARPIEYKIIYTPPMEEASLSRDSEITKEIVYDNHKYINHALNFWWMNVKGISIGWFLAGYALIVALLVTILARGTPRRY